MFGFDLRCTSSLAVVVADRRVVLSTISRI